MLFFLPFLILSFFWTSSAITGDFNRPAGPAIQTETQLLMQKHSSQAFWSQTRQSLPLSQIEEWKQIQTYPRLFYSFSKEIKKGGPVLDHFYLFFSKKYSKGGIKEKTEEAHSKIMKQIELMFKLFKEGSREEIQKFIKSQGFSKAEKILAVLETASHGFLAGEIFDLMSEISLSVNASLTFNELSPAFIPQELVGSNETALILSHNLLAGKNIQIIKKLMEQKIDFNLKPITKDNLIHFYIMSNQNLISKKEKKQFIKGLKVFLQLPQAKALLVDRNGLGAIPIQFALSHPNKKIRKIFTEEMIQLQLNPQTIQNSPTSISLWGHLMRSQTEQKNLPQISYLNFQAFAENLIHFFDPFQPTQKHRQIFVSFLADFHQQMMLVEQARLSILHNLLSNKTEAPANMSLFLKAIIQRDKSLFKKLNIQTAEEAEELFTNLLYPQPEDAYLLSNLLLEAVRQSFTPAVGYLLNLSQKFPSVQQILQNNKKIYSYTLDPLSLAFITYASLDHKDPLKPSAKKIIQLLYKNLPDFENYLFPLSVNPLEWALFLGLLEDVQFLHESKKIKFSPILSLEIDSQSWSLGWEFYSEEQGFKNLNKYLNSQFKTEEAESTEEIVERISRTTVKQASKAFNSMSPEDWLKRALGPKLLEKYKKNELRLKDLEDFKETEKSEVLPGRLKSPRDILADRIMEDFKKSIEAKNACKKIFR